MSSPSKSEVVAYSVAGELFDRLRARGKSPGEAMEQAARVFRAHRRSDLLNQARRRPLSEWMLETFSAIAKSHGVRMYQLRIPMRERRLVTIRSEAIYVVRALGLGTPVYLDLAAFFGCDHSSLVIANQKFEELMKADEVLAARVDRWVREKGRAAA